MTFFKQSETEQNIERLFLRIAEIQEQIDELTKENLALKFQIEHSIPTIKDNNGLLGRVEDLEVWRAKVHSMMILINPVSKKERLSPIAKKWGEKYSG